MSRLTIRGPPAAGTSPNLKSSKLERRPSTSKRRELYHVILTTARIFERSIWKPRAAGFDAWNYFFVPVSELFSSATRDRRFRYDQLDPSNEMDDWLNYKPRRHFFKYIHEKWKLTARRKIVDNNCNNSGAQCSIHVCKMVTWFMVVKPNLLWRVLFYGKTYRWMYNVINA